MAAYRTRLRAWAAVGLALFALLSNTALAFNYPLQPEEIDEAYALGRTTNREELADFLNQYEHDFKPPNDNSVAYVSSIEFQTPYEQIVLRSLGTTQYDRFKAKEDYEAGAGAVLVRVVVAFKTGYSGPAPAADRFRVTVSQEEPIDPVKTPPTRVLCDPYSLYQGDQCAAYMGEILLRFDHDQFGPGEATIKVLLPDEKSLETKFDLDQLK